jgi:hypothetical protein
VSVSDFLERLLPPDAPLERPKRRPGKRFKARERPALRHDGGFGIEVRIYKVEGNRDGAWIILFADAKKRFVSLVEIKNTDWNALARRGTLKPNVVRQARRLRSYLRGTAELIGDDERCTLRLRHPLDRSASIAFRRSPESSVRRGVEDAFGEYAVSVIWLDRPPPNADEFPTWEQILNGC